MVDVSELQSHVPGDTSQKEEISENQNKSKKYKWWIQMVIYSTFVLCGQAIGTLLGKLYFNNGGNNIWLASLVQNIGFPILIPFLFLSSTNNSKNNIDNNFYIKKPSFLVLVPFYVSLGLFLGGNCMLYSIGQFYLPVTTYTLISTSQLGFNALFSFFLNKQKITPFIMNSLVLLTISSSLLLLQKNEDDEPNNSNKYSKRKYIIGFLCTLAASAGYGLMLSMTRLSFEKIFKTESLRLIIEMTIYESLVASFANLVVIFASGEWKNLRTEMNRFELGKKSYVMNLIGTAISWQFFTLGSTGLIFKVSSLFSNVISMLGVPMAPVFSVLFLHEKMSGVKVISMFLAMWGFLSYMYQHYLDDLENKAEKRGGPMYEVSCIQARSRQGLHPEVGSHKGPYPEAGSREGPHPEVGSCEGPHPEVGSCEGPHPEARSCKGTHPEIGSCKGPHPEAGSREGTHPEGE